MPSFVIRFTDDGLYNEGDGFPVPLHQATVYPDRESAESVQISLFDSEIIELNEAGVVKPYTLADWEANVGGLKQLTAPREVLERLEATISLLDFYRSQTGQ